MQELPLAVLTMTRTHKCVTAQTSPVIPGHKATEVAMFVYQQRHITVRSGHRLLELHVREIWY
jgi:hypothetical protein